jgi:carbonic anhydrase
LEHNKDLAAQQSAAGILMPSLPRALPNVKAIIIGCADMRVDPAHVFGFKPGEAVNLRLREKCWARAFYSPLLSTADPYHSQ